MKLAEMCRSLCDLRIAASDRPAMAGRSIASRVDRHEHRKAGAELYTWIRLSRSGQAPVASRFDIEPKAIVLIWPAGMTAEASMIWRFAAFLRIEVQPSGLEAGHRGERRHDDVERG